MKVDNFKARRRYLVAEQLLVSAPGKVFPLLCPQREYDWIEQWECDLIFSESGFAELDCVFTTHFPGDEKETWVVDRYEPSSLIQFVRSCESRIIRYCIGLKDNGNGTTSAKWEQTITALNEAGNRYVESLSNAEFERKIKGLEKMLNHYLRAGEMLKAND